MNDLPAGRELDALVAEKVMGAMTEHTISEQRYIAPTFPVKPYSTDIAAAWEVVERMREWCWADIQGIGRPEAMWRATFRAMDALPTGEQWAPWEQIAPTAPLAICRAALKAVAARTVGSL